MKKQTCIIQTFNYRCFKFFQRFVSTPEASSGHTKKTYLLNLLVTKSDKSNITVILNKQNYLDKMQNLFDESSTYEKIDLDPLQKSQKTIFKKLDEWRKLNLLGDKIERKDLKTIKTNLARMYGLLKVHKENCPLRPVVSYINTP